MRRSLPALLPLELVADSSFPLFPPSDGSGSGNANGAGAGAGAAAGAGSSNGSGNAAGIGNLVESLMNALSGKSH